MGSPIDVGGQYPFITFFTPPRLSGKFLLWCDEAGTDASRVLSSSPGCLSFVRCVDFEFPPFSRMWAAYIELAGIVPLGSSQGQDSRESCDNSRTNFRKEGGG